MPTNNSGSSFYHSCLKVPINPSNGRPCPLYERKYDAFITMKAHKDSSNCGSRPVSGRSLNSQQKLANRNHLSERCCESDRPLRSFIEFYESIPDYGDMNHLSDEDFYRKLQNLKEKQKSYINSLSSGCSEENVQEGDKPEVLSKETSVAVAGCTDLQKGIVGVNCFDNRLKERSGRVPKIKNQFNDSIDSNSISNSWFQSPKPGNRKKLQKFLEPSTSEDSTVESIDNANLIKKNDENTGSEFEESKIRCKSSVEKNSILVNRAQKKRQKQLINISRDSSSKSVRKPYQQTQASSGSLADSVWDNFSVDDYNSRSGQSFSDTDSNVDLRCQDFPIPRQSKSVAWRDPKITVPQPFPMTIREKENQQIQLLKHSLIEPKRDHSPEEKKCFKANPIPITSRVPLFDKIMIEQENRRRKVKKQCIAELKSKMKPFSFVKRDEEERRCLMTHSSPELHNMCNPVKMFKAKPVPKHLFDSQVYERMREDEFYRTLRKRIRSEELLRSSSLPPSMAEREKLSTNKEKFSSEERNRGKQKAYRKKRNRKIPDYRMSHDILQMELEGRKNQNITTTPHPFHFETAVLHEKKCKRCESAKRCCHSSSYKTDLICKSRERPISAGPEYSLNRDNLASVLRIKSSRERTEEEKLRKRRERRQREEARLRERDFRRNPAWRIISGWSGVEEDLAIRACTRQQEERHRKQMHQHHMESMMSRVYQIPTLFERQSQVHISRKAVKEIQQKKALKIHEKDESDIKKMQRFSVRLPSKEDISPIPSPCDQTKIDSYGSYESDPEDDKTCHHSIGEDVEEGTGLEDEIKDEEEEVVEDNGKNNGQTNNFETLYDFQESNKVDEIKEDVLPDDNENKIVENDEETDKEKEDEE